VPEKGVNPLYPLGRFLSALIELEHPTDPDLGPSTVAPTLLGTDQSSGNVVPGEVWLTLDWRNVPGQEAGEVRDLLQGLADVHCAEAIAAEVTVPAFRRTAYTGLEVTIPASNPPYALAADHPAVRAAAALVDDELGGSRPVGIWRFATDGGHFAEAGVAPIGFGPGDELLAHTVDERIEIAALEEALRVNARFARELAAAGGR
jgi:acetylornithine deacetylase/succinyl-diaminopimelate desuccinylase-like protein